MIPYPWNLLVIGLAAVALIGMWAGPSLIGLLSRFRIGGSSKPDRDAAVKAYDTLKDYFADNAATASKLKEIWGELA